VTVCVAGLFLAGAKIVAALGILGMIIITRGNLVDVK